MQKASQAGGVTVARVARECGVSPATVSRACRADGAVNAATRARILDVAERVGYRPRVRMGRPRRPVTGRRGCVDVIMGARFQTTFYSVLLTSIECELAARRLDCVIRSADGAYQGFVQLCDALRSDPQRPTLLVGYLPAPQIRTLLEARPNTVLVDHTGDPALCLPYASVGFDNVEAARMMVGHLLDGGRRHILLLNGFREHYFSRDILRGYTEMLAQAGLEAVAERMVETDFSAADAAARFGGVLDAGTLCDAVFTTDEMAVAVLHELRVRGRRVPEDVAVAGCDGLPFGPYLDPPLSTVVLDHVRLGRLAVGHILDPERGAAQPLRMRVLPCLALRESSGGGPSIVSLSNKPNPDKE